MANRCRNNGNRDRLYFLRLQNHCGQWCRHEIQRHLLLGRKPMTNVDSVIKSRDITLPANVCMVKAIVFPIVFPHVTYGCNNWIIMKAESRRTNAFELWCWRILLIIPWKARRSNQSILNEISPEYSLEGLMMKLQLFGHLMPITDLLKKDPDPWKDWRQN